MAKAHGAVRDVLWQRTTEAAITLVDARGATVDLRPREGSLMGSTEAPRDFLACYSGAIEEWERALQQSDQTYLLCCAKDPISGCIVDLGLTVFADDIRRNHVASTVIDVKHKLEDANRLLDMCLGSRGYSQDKSKQVVLVSFVGRGSHTRYRSVFSGEAGLQGQCTTCTRYLGSQSHHQLRNGAERRQRLTAVRAGWAWVGRAWFKIRQHAALRLLFMAYVQSQAVSGLVAYVWNRGDCMALDTQMLKYLRALMKGKACVKAGAGNENAYRSMSNFQVWCFWRLVPTYLEVRIHRLRWYQSIARHPESSKQVSAAFFGRHSFESLGPVDAQGRITEEASPWTRQLYEDLKYAGSFEGLSNWWSDLQGRITMVFKGGELTDDFAAFDMNILRRAYYTGMQGSDEEGDAMGEEREKVYVCSADIAGSFACGLQFATKTGLALHLRKAHDAEVVERMLTTTNQCPFCMTVLCSKQTAQTHVLAACRSGVCRANRTPFVYTVREPDYCSCPACYFVTEEFAHLQVHLRQHFPCPPVEIVDDGDSVPGMDAAQAAGGQRRRRGRPRGGASQAGRGRHRQGQAPEAICEADPEQQPDHQGNHGDGLENLPGEGGRGFGRGAGKGGQAVRGVGRGRGARTRARAAIPARMGGFGVIPADERPDPGHGQVGAAAVLGGEGHENWPHRTFGRREALQAAEDVQENPQEVPARRHARRARGGRAGGRGGARGRAQGRATPEVGIGTRSSTLVGNRQGGRGRKGGRH